MRNDCIYYIHNNNKGEKMNKKQKEKLEALEHLRKLVKSGDTLYTQVNHVSKSGMTRDIAIRLIKDNQILSLTYWTAKLFGDPIKNNGVRVSGCGMDMGFHLVYNISFMLYNDGYALKHRWL
tara:strand:+ start:625 stop:990 length:366 start_codon:yes stop_codon:yes gene_type:complete